MFGFFHSRFPEGSGNIQSASRKESWLSHICKIIGQYKFQKKGQLGHPDEINAKEISLGRQMNTDEHGLKRKLVSPSARKNT